MPSDPQSLSNTPVFDPSADYQAASANSSNSIAKPPAFDPNASHEAVLKFDPNAFYESAADNSDSGPGFIGKAGQGIKQAFTGPTTLYGQIANQDAGAAKNTPYEGSAKIGRTFANAFFSDDAKKKWAELGQGAIDVLHGQIATGSQKMWDAMAPHITAGSPMERQMQALYPDFKAQAPAPDNRVPLNPVVDLGQFVDKEKHPIGKAIAETVSSFTTPENIAIMTSTGGLGIVNSAQKLAMANKLLSLGFAAQAIGATYEHSEAFKKAFDEGNSVEAQYQIAHAIMSGAITTIAAAHATGNEMPLASKTDLAVAGKVVEGASKVGEAAGNAVDLLSKPFSGASLEQLYYQLGKPGKVKGQTFTSTIGRALPALKEIVDRNQNVGSPEEMANAINQYRSMIDARILSRAEQLRGDPITQMVGIEQDTLDAMDKAFKENEGRYTSEEQREAKLAVLNQLLQEKVQGGQKSYLAEPDLFQAENVRQRFNKDIEFSVDATKEPVPAATKFAKEIAANILRQRIDEKYDQLGISGVKEWRQQEASLIDVRDQIGKAQDEANKRGEFNLFRSFLGQIKWTSVLLGMAGYSQFHIGGAAGGGLAGILLGTFHEWLTDRTQNPNALVKRIVGKTLEENRKAPARAATPTFSTATPASPRTINVPEQREGPLTGEMDEEDEFFGQRNRGQSNPATLSGSTAVLVGHNKFR